MTWARAIQSVIDSPRVAWAWAMSFLRREWSINDYPLRFRHFDNSSYCGPERLRPVDWNVRVLRWAAMQGNGATREEALQKLRESFGRYKERGEVLPRPGSYKPIEFADSSKVDSRPVLRDEFIADVLQVEWAFVSDESSLWDFTMDESLDELYARIRDRYRVDVSDIEGAKLFAIFERIELGR